MAVATSTVATLERVTVNNQNINTFLLTKAHDPAGKSVVLVFEPQAEAARLTPKALEYEFYISTDDKIPMFMSTDEVAQKLARSTIFEVTDYEWMPNPIQIMRVGYERTKLAFTPALKGQQVKLEALVEQGVDLAWQDKNGDTVFSLAVKGNKISDEYLQQMMTRHGANPFIVNKNGNSALSYACRMNRTDLIEQMLDASLPCIGSAAYPDSAIDARKSSINTKSKDNHTPLSHACMHVNQPVVHSLLNHGANPNLNWGSDKLPLYLAASKGDAFICNLLLEHGANPKAEIPWGIGPFSGLYSIKSFLNKTPNNELIKALLDNPPSIKELRSEVKIGFSKAVDDTEQPDEDLIEESKPFAQKLIQEQLDAEERKEDKKTPNMVGANALMKDRKLQKVRDNTSTAFGKENLQSPEIGDDEL